MDSNTEAGRFWPHSPYYGYTHKLQHHCELSCLHAHRCESRSLHTDTGQLVRCCNPTNYLPDWHRQSTRHHFLLRKVVRKFLPLLKDSQTSSTLLPERICLNLRLQLAISVEMCIGQRAQATGLPLSSSLISRCCGSKTWANKRYPTSCSLDDTGLEACCALASAIHPSTHPPPTAVHPAPSSRHRTAGWQDNPLTVNRLRFSYPGCMLRGLRLSGILIQEPIGCRGSRVGADRKRVGLCVAQCFTVTSKTSPGCVHSMHALRPVSFRLSPKLLEKKRSLHGRTSATDNASVTLVFLLPLSVDVAADPAAAPHNIWEYRPVP